MIEVEHLSRRYHDLVAVDDISLSVKEGEVLGFLGPNGAGKSTTIKILTGFLPASSGRASVAGYNVATQSLQVRRSLGYLPENVSLPPDARVEEYLDYRGRLKGLGRTERRSHIDRVLDECGLLPMRRRILSQLSRGYRQRVGLADALLADPKVLFLDEPTGGLDPAQRQEVLALIGSLAGQRTVMLSSHVLNEVEGVCTQVAIIKQGAIVAQGSPADLEQAVGRHNELHVEIRGGAEVLNLWAKSRGLARRPHERAGLVITLSDQDDPDQLLKSLLDQGQSVVRWQPLTRSLQQIFLDLTRA
ncbi:MAG: ABC-2 type transport system ATP-binding protein [Pseudohongiellaceae bacterium]